MHYLFLQKPRAHPLINLNKCYTRNVFPQPFFSTLFSSISSLSLLLLLTLHQSRAQDFLRDRHF